MMLIWRAILLSTALILIPCACSAAEKHIEVDTGECGSDTSVKASKEKSDVFTDKVSGIQAYGSVIFQRLPNKTAENHCYVIFKLYVASSAQNFKLVKQSDEEIADGQIAAIELIGLSPDKTKFAANFSIAEGDSQEHGPVVYDLVTKTASYLKLEDRIQKLIHGCDQLEDFIGVTNAGETVFAVPPSDYVDSPECGDKGVWRFNLKTGRVSQVSG